MDAIDYDRLNAEVSPTARSRGARTRGRLALPLLCLVGGSAIAYLIYADATRTVGRFTDRDSERFTPSQFQVRTFEDPPPKREDAIQVPKAEPPPTPAPTTIVQHQGPDLEAQRRLLEEQRLIEEARRRAEADRLASEEERRRQAEAEKMLWERLRSPLIIVDNENTGALGREGERGPSETGAIRIGAEMDGNRQFLNATAAQDVEVARATRNRRIDALVAQGTMIRGILETAIQSDLPGQVRAVTTEDVWSFDGRRVLIPSGTRLIGEYRSGLARGQIRVFIVWTRMLRSDGVSVSLGSIGTDDLGRAGLSGEVDNHYFERFGSAILLSLVGGASQYIAGLGQQPTQGFGGVQFVDPVTGRVTILGPNQDYYQQNARQIAAATVSQTLTQLAQEALRDSINIPPTIHVDQGARIMIFVRRDLDFSGLYPDPVRVEARRLLSGGRPRPLVDPTPVATEPLASTAPIAPPLPSRPVKVVKP